MVDCTVDINTDIYLPQYLFQSGLQNSAINTTSSVINSSSSLNTSILSYNHEPVYFNYNTHIIPSLPSSSTPSSSSSSVVVPIYIN